MSGAAGAPAIRRPCYTDTMRNTAKFFTAGAFALLLTAGPAAQEPPRVPAQPPATPAPQAPSPNQPTFRASIDLVTTDVIARDNKGQFVADLKVSDFDVF